MNRAAAVPRGRRQRPILTPISTVPGMAWPAVPGPRRSILLGMLLQFEHSQWSPPEAIEAMQMRQLELLFAHAARTTPFYAERFGSLKGLKVGELTAEHVRTLPVLRRRDLQEEPESLVTRALPKQHGTMVDVYSSGSTGRPVCAKGTAITSLFLTAFNLRLHLWHGRDFSATVAAIQVLKPKQAKAAAENKGVQWAGLFGESPMYYFDIGRPVGEQVRWLVELDPAYVLTYPSNAAELAIEFGRQGLRLPRLHHVAALGEAVTAEQRAACREHLGADIVDAYSAQEVGVMALQCPGHPHYLVQSESAYLEVVDDDGRPCGPGEIGRVLVTDLHNFATPLIRYEIGDYAEVGGPCPTGRGLPVLTRIMGRTRNMLVLASGEKVWPPFRLGQLGQEVAFGQMQLVQRAIGEIDVNVVRETPFTADEDALVRRRLAEQIGHPVTVNIAYVDAIGRSASGKYEEFRSEVA